MGLQTCASSELEIRIDGTPDLPTLVYLPGSHGDWTLAGAFRNAILGKVRLVSVAYPCTTSWTVQDHAEAVSAALLEHQIESGWLLGESFGSQVAWALVDKHDRGSSGTTSFRPEGIVLAGGFIRYPINTLARFGNALCGARPIVEITAWTYLHFVLARSMNAPDIDQFKSRRVRPGDFEALRHRLKLIAENNPNEIARSTTVPVYSLSGFFDTLVPWLLINDWLRRNCPAFRESKVLFGADHIVLGTAPEAAADQILKWMGL